MTKLSPPLHDAESKPQMSARTYLNGPLTGLKVIELGSLLAGPFAGRLLGDFGALVIKVESPKRPDPMRDWGHARYKNRSLWWPIQSRNKKLITIDLSVPEGQAIFLRLVRKTDVVIENFRPGTLEKWGLGYERLQQENFGLILARISGFGQTGPYSHRAGFASVAEAMGGLRYINGFPGQDKPPRMGISLGDSLAAMFATQAILAALHFREGRGQGRGQVIDTSLMESCFALLESAVPEYDRLQTNREPSGTGLRGIAPSNLFPSQDGKLVVIAANSENVFRRLCEAMGQPELADDPRFSSHTRRGMHQDELEAIVAAWAARNDARDIDQRLNEAGVVSGLVYTIADIFEDPHYREREMLVEHRDPELGTFLGPGVVPKLSLTPGRVRWSGRWAPGFDNQEILSEIAELTDDEIAELAGKGVV